jgi:hypothetical protein
MNKLTTFLAASLLSISSLAAADTSARVTLNAGASINVTVGAPAPAATGAVIVRDHRYDDRYDLATLKASFDYRKPKAPVWRELGSVKAGEKQILRPGDVKLDSLKLDVTGRLTLSRIDIVFSDNQRQVVRYDDLVLTASSQMPVIQLVGANRTIKKILVYSTGNKNASLSFLGRNDTRIEASPTMPGWTKLGAVASGNQHLAVSTTKRLDSIAFATTGKVHLKKVIVQFTSGAEQTFMFDETLTAGSRSPVLDLRGQDRLIKQLIVVSEDAYRGELTFFAI